MPKSWDAAVNKGDGPVWLWLLRFLETSSQDIRQHRKLRPPLSRRQSSISSRLGRSQTQPDLEVQDLPRPFSNPAAAGVFVKSQTDVVGWSRIVVADWRTGTKLPRENRDNRANSCSQPPKYNAPVTSAAATEIRACQNDVMISQQSIWRQMCAGQSHRQRTGPESPVSPDQGFPSVCRIARYRPQGTDYVASSYMESMLIATKRMPHHEHQLLVCA